MNELNICDGINSLLKFLENIFDVAGFAHLAEGWAYQLVLQLVTIDVFFLVGLQPKGPRVAVVVVVATFQLTLNIHHCIKQTK